MTARFGWDTWSVAPRVSHGAPADVLHALETIGDALVRGARVESADLRWPEEPLRTALLDTIASTEVRNATCMRPTAVAVALDDIVTVLEHAWATERKMRAGRSMARTHAQWMSDGLDDAAIRTLWEPLADRGVRAELRARWVSIATVFSREAPATGAPLVDWDDPGKGAHTLGDAERAMARSLESSADGAAFVARISLQIASPPRVSSVSRPAIDPDQPMTREQATQWLRWRRAVVAKKHRDAERARAREARRTGPVYISLGPTESEDELSAIALLMLASTAARWLGRTAYVVVSGASSDPRSSIEQVLLTRDSPLRDLFECVRSSGGARPLAAMSWLLSQTPADELVEADFVLISTSSDVVGEPLIEPLREQIERARSVMFRTHLLRMKSMAAHPAVQLFDMLHFPEFTPRFFEAMAAWSSLRLR